MAFRRKFSRRFRRPFRRGRPLAKVRRTWVTSFRKTLCDPTFEIPLVVCEGPNALRMVLLSSGLLESGFSDRATVKRIVGDLWIQPTYDGTDGTCPGDVIGVLTGFVQQFAGLIKTQVDASGDLMRYYPLNTDFDFSEAEWLKTWQYMWIPNGELQYTPSTTFTNCAPCPDVHTTGAPDNIFTEGTGTIDIETDCSGEPVTCASLQDPICRPTFNFLRYHHMHFDVKKSISLRENEELRLDFQWMYPGAGSVQNPRVQLFGGIKCLVQY